jgi:tetratricopeptide (TPR) repeat protein
MGGLVRLARTALTGFWAIVAALVVAAPAILAAAGAKRPVLLAVAVGAAAVAAVFSGLLVERYRRLTQRRDDETLAVVDGCLMIGSRPPRVREISDPGWLGVRSAPLGDRMAAADAGSGLSERQPVYVPRDVDDRLRERVATGGFVLLVGDSTSGKSRAAYEAVAVTLPDDVLFAPRDRAALGAVASRAVDMRRCVVWLNDLETYFGVGGLTPTMVARLLASDGHRVIVATMRAAEMARYVEEAGPADKITRQLFRDARETIEQAHLVRIERMLSGAERERAEARAWDPRIAEALRHADDYGLAEYIAAGPELLRDWENAWEAGTHPRGAAFVAAAVDCRRIGLSPPLPYALLAELHEDYLTRRGGRRLRPESIAKALEWATKPRRSTTALMAGSETAGYDVFDYLVDTLQNRNTPDTQVADTTILQALDYADSTDMTTIGWTAYEYGRYTTAALAAQRALNLRTTELGAEHPDTLTSRNNLAVVVGDLGRLEESEAEHRAILQARTRILGPDHPDTLASRHSLARVLFDQGRFDEAETEHRDALHVLNLVLGPEHPDTVGSRHSLSRVLFEQGRWDEAATELRAVVEARTRIFGADHPHTLITRNSLGFVLTDLGRLKEADAELRAVVQVRTRALGPEHPHTLIGRNNLARVSAELGRLDEALAEHRAVLRARIQILGHEHPYTLGSRKNVARVLLDLGRLEEAEAEYRTVLETRTRLFGPEHPHTLSSRDNLARVAAELGRLDEALAEHHAVLQARTRILGPEHPNTLTSRYHRARVLAELGRLDEAQAEHHAVLQARTRILGPEHPDTVSSRDDLDAVRKRIEQDRRESARPPHRTRQHPSGPA